MTDYLGHNRILNTLRVPALENSGHFGANVGHRMLKDAFWFPRTNTLCLSWASLLDFVLRFWNQVFTCFSVRFNTEANSARLLSVTYWHFVYSFSMVSIWLAENNWRCFLFFIGLLRLLWKGTSSGSWRGIIKFLQRLTSSFKVTREWLLDNVAFYNGDCATYTLASFAV